MLKKVLFYTIFIAFTGSLAAQIESVQGGNWSDASTWSSASAPGCTIDGGNKILVKHTVLIGCTNFNLTSNDTIVVKNGGYLYVNDCPGVVRILVEI